MVKCSSFLGLRSKNCSEKQREINKIIIMTDLTVRAWLECYRVPDLFFPDRYHDHPKGGLSSVQSDVIAHVTYCLVSSWTSV